jgi:outer membrane protein assembly factor BamE
MSNRLILLTLFTSLLLGGCVKSYKFDVQQGNVVDQERLSQIERGMSKADVQTLLGTPLVQSSFHPDRWDYFYALKKSREKDWEQRLITLYFDNGKLAEIRGDVTRTIGQQTPASQTETIVVEDKKEPGVIRRTWDRIWD